MQSELAGGDEAVRWLDWKLRDVVVPLSGLAIFMVMSVGGGILSNFILEALGAPPPDGFEGTLLGALTAVLGGIALGYIFAVQLGAGRRIRGMFSATMIVLFAVMGASALQAAANLIENELLSLLGSLLLGGALLAVLAGGCVWWTRRNRWVVYRLSGRGHK